MVRTKKVAKTHPLLVGRGGEPSPKKTRKRNLALVQPDAPLDHVPKGDLPQTTVPAGVLEALAGCRHSDPHQILGRHEVRTPTGPATAFRAVFPGAESVAVEIGDTSMPMRRIHSSGIFEAVVPGRADRGRHQFLVRDGGDGPARRVDDAYSFPVTVSDMDRWLFGEGTLTKVSNLLGAHPMTVEGVEGYNFVVWAPNAERVSVVGDFNGWDGRQNPMRRLDGGVWEVFLPGVGAGSHYKFEIRGPNGNVFLKADPAAQQTQLRPDTASVTRAKDGYEWGDKAWMKTRAAQLEDGAPISAYEVHLPSWKKKDGEMMSYREIADQLVPYLVEHNFTHVELMALAEHPFDGSWGYQVTGYYAPTSRHGDPEGLKYLVDKCHQAGIGVLYDWVPAHFPKDGFALHKFDGTNLFDHQDDRRGAHKDWGTRVFNYGRNEVRAFLIGGLTHMLDEYHLDGVRADAVASMLYRDYSRKQGEWIPNEHGGNHDLEAIGFLKQANAAVAKRGGILRVAEESTAYDGVTRPDGLDFDRKWNMGWMNDTLNWFKRSYEQRGGSLDQLTNTLIWVHSEKHMASLSHDEVVHGKGSLLEKMPGDDWQKFANLRSLFAYMWSYPGQKLLFMGQEFGQRSEWNDGAELEWGSRENPRHRGAERLVTDLNQLYRSKPALHERQYDGNGVEIVSRDPQNVVVAMKRKAKEEKDDVLFVHNFTPEVRREYRIGVDRPGTYREILNTDAEVYGGSGVTNGQVEAEAVPMHGKPYSVALSLPPLGSLALEREA